MAKKEADSPPGKLPEQQAPGETGGGDKVTQNAWRNIRLITRREYKNLVTDRKFIVSTIILLALVVFLTFLPTIVQFISEQSSSRTQVAVVNNAGPIANLDQTALTNLLNTVLNGTSTAAKPSFTISIQPPGNFTGLENQVKNGKWDILLEIHRSPQGKLQFLYESDSDPERDSNLPQMQAVIGQLAFLDNAFRLGLIAAQTQGLISPPDTSIVHTQPARPTNEIIAGYALGFTGAFLIYVSVVIYCRFIGMGVAEEKSSRIMEILINAATPFQLLIGKIVGIGAACLTQMSSLVAVGILSQLVQTPLQTALFGTTASGFSDYLTSVSLGFYPLFLTYFLLHFLLYAIISAGLSSMVKRLDEVEGTFQVPSIFLVGSWILVYVGAGFPNALWFKILSYFPFFSGELMMIRLGLGGVAGWEILLTIGLTFITILGCLWFSVQIYRLGVLMYGQRPGFGQLVKMVFAINRKENPPQPGQKAEIL